MTFTPTRPIWKQTGSTSTTPTSVYLPPQVRQVKVWVDDLSYVGIGATAEPPSVTAVGEAYLLTASGGTPGVTYFTLVFDDEETGLISIDASGSAIATTLVENDNVPAGGFTGTGGLPGGATLTGAGAFAGAGPLPPLVVGQMVAVSAGSDQHLLLLLAWPLDVDTTAATVTITKSALGTGASEADGAYGYVEADTQEVWDVSNAPLFSGGSRARYLYVAAVTGTSTYRATGYLIA